MQRSFEELYVIATQCRAKLAAIKADLARKSANPTRQEAFEIVKEFENPLIDLALATRGLANSYRNFDVGTVSVALAPILTPGHHAWALRFAANTKEENGEKYCGEQRLMDTALRKRVSHIIAFVIAAEPQTDHGSNRKGITLTPCEACRWRMRGLMREHHPIVARDTMVISVNSQMPWARKYQRVEDLYGFHCEPLDEE